MGDDTPRFSAYYFKKQDSFYFLHFPYTPSFLTWKHLVKYWLSKFTSFLGPYHSLPSRPQLSPPFNMVLSFLWKKLKLRELILTYSTDIFFFFFIINDLILTFKYVKQLTYFSSWNSSNKCILQTSSLFSLVLPSRFLLPGLICAETHGPPV